MSDSGEYQGATQTAPPPPEPPAPPAAPPMPEPEPPRRSNRSGGVTAGIILILIGAALLISRFTGEFRIWELWPFFIIVPGVIQCFTPGDEGWTVHRFFDGLITVTIGLILLGNTTGYISWSVWWEVIRLWPVLLISAGLSILGKAVGQNWLRVLGTLVVLAAFGFAVAASVASSPIRVLPTTGGDPFSFEEPVTTPDASLTLKSGVGEIEIDDTSGRRVRVVGSSPYGEPRFDTSRTGSKTELAFSLTGDGQVTAIPGTASTRVSAELPRAVPWEIVVDSGVATLDADLSDLEVANFRLKTGVSSNTVRLGDAPRSVDEALVSIESGVASVKVLVPSDAEARIESSSGLTGVDVAAPFERGDGRSWETPGFEDAQRRGEPVWIISAKSGIGSFAVETY